MGWLRFSDEEFTYDHEGYLVMVVEDEWHMWRELALFVGHRS